MFLSGEDKLALLELNPWAASIGKTLAPESNDDLVVRRRRACVQRARQGPRAWNAWAAAMTQYVQRYPDDRWVRFIALTDFRDQTFDDVLDLSAALFPGPLDAAGMRCLGAAHFSAATFAGAASFRGAAFGAREGVWLDRTAFRGEAAFNDVTFAGPVEMRKAEFADRVTFQSARLKGDIWAAGSRFFNAASFETAAFEQTAGFGECSFGGPVRFAGAVFGGSAGFEKALFLDVADFEGAEFDGKVWLNDASFRTEARFGLVKFRAAVRADRLQLGAPEKAPVLAQLRAMGGQT